MKPFIIPFFIPHEGCPHRCVFCDQHRSAGARPEPVTPENVAKGIEQALISPRLEPSQPVEAAFFGGTFTALPRSRQEELLSAAAPFVQNSRVNSLRVSTRPDAVDEDRLSLLKYYHVRTVELGAQSMDDRVLFAAERGHTAADTRRAAELIRSHGLRLGIQLLVGLPEEDEASRDLTLRQTLALIPDDARIYPVLVIKGTILETMFRQGRYQPLDLQQALDISADYYTALTRAGTNVIRLGLHAEPKLADNTVAGPIHPAFGELVKSEVYYRALVGALLAAPSGGKGGHGGPPLQVNENEIQVAPHDLSQAQGHQKTNLAKLRQLPGCENLTIRPNPTLTPGRFWVNGQQFSIYE